MKKRIVILLISLLAVLSLSLVGCLGTEDEPETEEKTPIKFSHFEDGSGALIQGVDWDVCTTTDIVIPATSPKGVPVVSVAAGAFENDTKITSIVLPEGLDRIQEGAFKNCTSLKSVKIPDSVDTIRESAFFGCTALEEAKLPASLFQLGDNAFWGCQSLKSVEIPELLGTIGNSAFASCSSLESITVSENNSTFVAVDNCLMRGKNMSTKSIVLGCKTSKIPTDGSVSSIGSYAFSGSDLTSIILPEGIEYVGDCAFSGCTSVTSISLPESLTHIGYSAFYGCEGITEVHIGKNVVTIEYGAFGLCSNLTDVYFDNVKSSWEYVQLNQGGYPFEEVTCTVHCTDGSIEIVP